MLRNVVKFAKKQLLIVLVAVCIVYCVVVMVRQLQDGDTTVADNELDEVEPRQEQPFKWHSTNDEEINPSNSTRKITCRNSVQGKILITDDRGYVCKRTDVLPSGCCDIKPESTVRYQCKTCHNNHCCSVYENCISCCLHPSKISLLQSVLGKTSQRFNLLFASVSDHFELCLAKCRTSSLSVQHENSYRNPRIKYCYGESAPALQPFAGK